LKVCSVFIHFYVLVIYFDLISRNTDERLVLTLSKFLHPFPPSWTECSSPVYPIVLCRPVFLFTSYIFLLLDYIREADKYNTVMDNCVGYIAF